MLCQHPAPHVDADEVSAADDGQGGRVGNGRQQRMGLRGGNLKVFEQRPRIKPKFPKTDQVVSQLILLTNRIGHSTDAAKAVCPSQPGTAEHTAAAATELLHDIRFTAAEAAKLRMEPDPCLPSAREQSHSLLPDLERLAARIAAALVDSPCPRRQRPMWVSGGWRRRLPSHAAADP